MPKVLFEDQLIAIAEMVLAKEGVAIAALLGLSPEAVEGITFRVDVEQVGVAATSGSDITLFKKYFDKNQHDVAGVTVHEAVHAIQKAAIYDGAFVWMIEGLADFIRYKLGYGEIKQGDPTQSYQIAGGFFNWLYEDNKKNYFAFVKDVTDGVMPHNLQALLKDYNCGAKAVPPVKKHRFLRKQP